MNILIIEDELLVAVSLKKLLKQLEPTSTLHGPIASVAEAKAWLKHNEEPNLIISDVQLSDGIALDIFDHEICCPIIFTTAYNEYAIKAFKLNSIDYLLKPVDLTDLESAFKKYHLLQSKFSNDTYLKQLVNLFANFGAAKKFKERFAVHIGRSVTLIPTEEIALFTKEEVIYLINHEGKRFITDFRSLDEIQELVDPKIFCRANRQNLVHIAFIESYRGDDTGKITLKMRNIRTHELIVSKEKAAEFRRWFD